MLPLPLYSNALTSSPLDDIEELLLLSVLASLGDGIDEEEDGDGENEDEEQIDYIEEEELEDEENEESGIEEMESDEETQDEEEVEADEPVAPKRRRLFSYVSSQSTEAGTSAGSIVTITGTSGSGSFSFPSSSSSRQSTSHLNTSQAAVPMRVNTSATSQSPVGHEPLLQQIEQSSELSGESVQLPTQAYNQNVDSRAQVAQSVSQQNGSAGPSARRQTSQHNLPQARVVLQLPNIGDMYPREE